ncbi:MAG: HAMP domain-containing protein [Rhodospirillales bacterium]|nr:HAMP domain-containing protein [Rhodospirillales bacterium]
MSLNRVFRTTGFRLAALYAGLFGLSVLVLLAVIYWITGSALSQQFAASIEAEVAALVEDYNRGGLQSAAGAIDQLLASRVHRKAVYLLLDRNGRKVAGDLPERSPQFGWQKLPAPREPGERRNERDDDGAHQLIALGVALPDESFLLVGRDTFPIAEVEEAIVRTFGWAFGITAVLAVIGGGVLSLSFLRRVDAINRTTRAIIEGRLTDRVPTRGTNDELDRLAFNLNEMLDRVQALMESLRQVSSDIAHDLRTPLARLRQRLEGARLKARTIPEYEIAVDDAIADCDAILRIFAALLRIAQIEAGTRKAAFSTVDLSRVAQSIADAYGAVAEDGGRSLSAEIAPDVRVLGDRELLTQMLANLVENAICHTPAGARIQLVLCQGAQGPLATIADTGPGIPAEAREMVFKRFARLDRSRSDAGSGLGLSLVAAVAEIHGIAVTLRDAEPGLKVVLDFAPGRSA